MAIWNLGSLNMDQVYEVAHFVQAEETITADGHETFLGGKGLNQSVAAARAGAQVRHIGTVGQDGDALLAALRDNGIDDGFVQKTDGPSGHAIIQRSWGQNCIIVFKGANHRVTEAQVDAALAEAAAGDILLMQNETSCVSYALEQGKKRGLRTAFNASPITSEIADLSLDGLHWLLVNEVEGRVLCGKPDLEEKELLHALMAKYPETAIVLTLGSAGAYYGSGDEILFHAAYRVPVADTTGAGDTFCGYFLAEMDREGDAAKALEYASLAAGLAVTKKGAVPSIPTRAEVESFQARSEC